MEDRIKQDNKKEMIAEMRDKEIAATKRLRRLLKTTGNYGSFNAFRKRFYNTYVNGIGQ